MSNFLKYSILALIFIFIGLVAGFKIKGSLAGGTGLPADGGLKKIQQALYFIDKNYVEKPDQSELIEDAVEGIMDELDPHSIYIPAKELSPINEEMEGGFDGIGVQFNILEDTIYIETPLAGGPSEKVGIMSGDRIVEVDGKLVAGIKINNTDVYKYLKGPKGSKVKLGIKRRGHKELLEFTVTRDRIPLNSVDYAYMIAPQIGYIGITRFAETTYDEFRAALIMLKKQGMEKLLLDLRGNPGGYMQMAYRIADEFLPAGKTIVSTEGRIADYKNKYNATSTLNLFENGPLVVLLDYGSASASEIVAGAVQDHDRGLIVGIRSFGKGLVAIQEDFEDGSAIRVVIAKYYTPSGRCIQKPYDKTEEEYQKDFLERYESGELFDESKISFPDSLKYKTGSGRTVYGGGGIYPDVFVANDTSGGSRYLINLRLNNVFQRFAVDYVDSHPSLTDKYKESIDFVKGFTVSSSMVQEFIDFAKEREVPFNEYQFNRSKAIIVNQMKAFIGRKMFSDDGFYPVLHQRDRVIQRAIKLMPVAKKLEENGELDISLKEY
ncbi:MAG: S41 family peptidase [Bacteroidia bacterium]|nr:S41 family peptidase [Bacteroidia bacterium]